MQQQQQTPTQTSRLRRRHEQRSEFSPGILTTAVSIGVVLILISVTFVADWLHTPDVTLSLSSGSVSPNNDRANDLATINYNLSEDANVTVEILSPGGGISRVLLINERQAAGNHFITWDGRNDLGAVVSDGDYRVQISAKGSLRSAVQGIPLVVDTRPPPLQLANLPNRARVGQNILTVEGVTEPSALVTLSGTAQPIPVDSQGHFNFQQRLNEGDNSFEIRAVDQAGNTSRLQRQVTLVTAAPDLSLTSPQDGDWTNQPLVTIKGHAAPGLLLTVNDQTISLDEDGNFEHQIMLDEGDNTIVIQAVDDVGNVTNLERVVHVKTIAPEVQLSVADGMTVSDPVLQLTGRTDPGATVLINGRVVPTSALGDFQTSLNMDQGDNTVQVEARDQAGNATTLLRRVRYAMPQPEEPLARLLQNLEALPSITIPLLVAIGLIIALIIFRQNQVSLRLSVDQTAFTPGLPEEDRNLNLSMDLNKSARVSLEVLDQQGRPVATLLHNRRRSGRVHIFQWDGYDDYGKPVQPGEYTIQAMAGTPPITVISAVQVTVKENSYLQMQAAARRASRGGSVASQDNITKRNTPPQTRY